MNLDELNEFIGDLQGFSDRIQQYYKSNIFKRRVTKLFKKLRTQVKQ
jgi:hypothetical protein